MNITNQMKEDITKEVNNLKRNLSSRELNNLNINTFDTKTAEGNIYGIIAGNSNSTRIKELLNKCAIPYSQKLHHHIPVEENTTFEDRKEFQMNNENNVYSTLEYVLFNNPELWENVIGYLTSTIPTLEFSHAEERT